MSKKRYVDDRDEDLDKPAAPGGPNRTDAAEGPFSPGTPAIDPGTDVKRVTRPEGTQPPPPQHDDDAEQSPQEVARQEENAEESEFGEPSQ